MDNFFRRMDRYSTLKPKVLKIWCAKHHFTSGNRNISETRTYSYFNPQFCQLSQWLEHDVMPYIGGIDFQRCRPYRIRFMLSLTM